MAHAVQKVRFGLYHWPRWLLGLLSTAVLISGSRRSALGTYRGISICRSSFSRVSGAEFLRRTIEALDLVERFDERRFKRIQREIRFLMHMELPSGAQYIRTARFCQIDYTRYDFAKDYDWYLRCYAAALVHEATHGAIYSRYVAHTRCNHLRIERLCHTEELRFLKRLDTSGRLWSEQIAGAFDEQYYSAGLVSRLRTLWQRIAEVRKRS